MVLPVIKLESDFHRDMEVIKILFKRNEELMRELRKFKDLRWSKTLGAWYCPWRKEFKDELFRLMQGKVWLDYSALNRNQLQAAAKAIDMQKPPEKNVPIVAPLDEKKRQKLEEFRRWMLSKRYSPSTVKTYTEALECFLRFFTDKSPETIDNRDLIEFNNLYILKNNLSGSYQNQVVNAVKLFFRTVEGRKLDPELVHRPKREKLLPNVLSKEEVKALLFAHENIKHRCMLALVYSCGLRSGELLSLIPDDLDERRGLLIIRQAKGRKDRIVPLSKKIVEELKSYKERYRPCRYLFEGQRVGEAYDKRSLQQVLKQAVHKAGITRPVTLHWLRHSYATHLLENGTDLRYIQEVLGHRSSKTTEIYTHVSRQMIQKIVSPYDYL